MKSIRIAFFIELDMFSFSAVDYFLIKMSTIKAKYFNHRKPLESHSIFDSPNILLNIPCL